MTAFQGWVIGAELAKTKRTQVAKALAFFRQGALIEAWLAWRQALLNAADERSKLAKVRHLCILIQPACRGASIVKFCYVTKEKL